MSIAQKGRVRTYLVAVATTHSALHSRDRNVRQGCALGTLDEDARKQPNEILCMYDGVRRVGWHSEADRKDQAVIPLLVRRRDLLRDATVRCLRLLAKKNRLGSHLSTFEVDELLEAEYDDVGAVDAVQGIFEEVHVLRGSGERVGFRGIEVVRYDQDFHVSEGAEFLFSFHKCLIYSIRK